jgi:GTP-binding protein YchF
MSLSIGIVGLPNVGKSTLFNALTKKSVPAENYPFCTIDPSVGVVAVPDDRLWQLSKFSNSAKTLPAVIEFVDIAGLVKGASEGQGLGNKFLANIRETDAILEVVRIFEDADVIHVEGGIDPIRDIGVINLELILSDLETVNKRLGSVERDKKRGDKDAVIEHDALIKIKDALEKEKLANTVELDEKEAPLIKQLNLLTRKPFLYALNKKIGGKNLDEIDKESFNKVVQYIEQTGGGFVLFDAKAEEEMKDFTDEEKLELVGKVDNGIENLIRGAYKLLGLMTYFTTGEDETRGWTIPLNSTARDAGAAIHNDFRDKFIRAEIIFWKDLLDAGSFANARSKGLVRTEGKEYIVKDGDVIEFKI